MRMLYGCEYRRLCIWGWKPVGATLVTALESWHLWKLKYGQPFRQQVGKPMHGLFFGTVQYRSLSTTLTFAFLRSERLSSETEGIILEDGAHIIFVHRSQVMGIAVVYVSCRSCHLLSEPLMQFWCMYPIVSIDTTIRHKCCTTILGTRRYGTRHPSAGQWKVSDLLGLLVLHYQANTVEQA